MLLCLILTLSTSNLFTCPLVNSSTQRYVTLSFTYPVYKQLVHSSTKHVNSFTCNLVNFFQPKFNTHFRLIVAVPILSSFFLWALCPTNFILFEW